MFFGMVVYTFWKSYAVQAGRITGEIGIQATLRGNFVTYYKKGFRATKVENEKTKRRKL